MTHPTRVMNGNSRTADKFVVRMEEGLRDRVAQMAASQHRSMNSYVIRSLNKSLREDENGGASVKQVMGTNMPCRVNGAPGIIIKMYFFKEVLTVDVVDAKGNGWTVDYDELEPY